MYERYDTVLLDLDADFMLSDHYEGSGDYDDEVRITTTGRQFGRVVQRLQHSGTEVRLIIDHHEALYWWDKRKVRNALCIHIDAHHDMWHNGRVTDDRTKNRKHLECGCYLQQALRDEVVEKVLYIPAPFRCVYDERSDISFETRGDGYDGYGDVAPITESRIVVRSWKWFQQHRIELPKADIITIAISPDFFPQRHWRQVEALCNILQVPQSVVKSKKTKAYSCWRDICKLGAHNDFIFPYVGTEKTE